MQGCVQITHTEADAPAGRTTIFSAHRLSTVRNADRISVLTENGIGEEGDHDTLLAAGGIYASPNKVQTSI